MPGVSEEDPLLGARMHHWASPVRTRRNFPVSPSSWPPSTTCCPWALHAARPLPKTCPALELGILAEHQNPCLPMEGILGVPSHMLQSPGSKLSREARALQKRSPAQGLTSGLLEGRPRLWALWETPRLRRGNVTTLTPGGGRSIIQPTRWR